MTYVNLIISFLMFVPVMIVQMFIPYLTRQTVSFGISVSEEVYYSKPVASMRKAYAVISASFYVVLIVIMLFMGGSVRDNVRAAVWPVIIVAILAVSAVLHLYFYFKMKKFKAALPPVPPDQKPTLTIDTGFRKQRLVLSGKWFLIHFAVIAACVWFVLAKYNRIESPIPMHYDFQGQVDAYREKSYAAVLLPNIMQLFITLLMMFINWMIPRAKQQLSPADPKASASHNAIFRIRWSFFCFLSGLGLVFLFFFMQLTMIYKVDYRLIAPVSLIFPVLMLAAVLVIAFTTGQGGSRIGRKSREAGNQSQFPVNDDSYWKLGSFYFNPQDPSLFIEKRMGVGWTVNLARPTVWVILIVLIAVIVLIRLLKA